MKVLLVSRWASQCGVATYTDQLAFELSKLDISLECAAESIASNADVSSSIPVTRCWNGKQSSYKDLIVSIIRNKPSIIHIQHEFGIYQNKVAITQLFSELAGSSIPIVVTCHTVVAPPHHLGWFFLECLPKASLVIVHSEGAKQALIRWKLLRERLRLIPHGTIECCDGLPKTQARSMLYLPEDPRTVIALSLGFITEGKMQQEAIQAIVSLAHEGIVDTTKFLYIIVGIPGQETKENQEYCRSLHRMIDKNRAWNYIRIYPHFVKEKDLKVWYGAADFVITGSHPTAYSISGRSHQEMAYGMPSVSANAELLSDLNPYRSLKYSTEHELKWGIMQMIQNPCLRQALSSRCKSFAEVTSWRKIAIAHHEAYKDAIKIKRNAMKEGR